jgi:hypothetical protein
MEVTSEEKMFFVIISNPISPFTSVEILMTALSYVICIVGVELRNLIDLVLFLWWPFESIILSRLSP